MTLSTAPPIKHDASHRSGSGGGENKKSIDVEDVLVNDLISTSVEHLNAGKHLLMLLPRLLMTCPLHRFRDVWSAATETAKTRRMFTAT